MDFIKVKEMISVPSWRGGGKELAIRYERKGTLNIGDLSVSYTEHSSDGVNVDCVKFNTSFFRSGVQKDVDSVKAVIKPLFIDYISNCHKQYESEYMRAKSKYKDDYLSIFCFSIDINQYAEKWFSKRIYDDFKKMIA